MVGPTETKSNGVTYLAYEQTAWWNSHEIIVTGAITTASTTPTDTEELSGEGLEIPIIGAVENGLQAEFDGLADRTPLVRQAVTQSADEMHTSPVVFEEPEGTFGESEYLTRAAHINYGGHQLVLTVQIKYTFADEVLNGEYAPSAEGKPPEKLEDVAVAVLTDGMNTRAYSWDSQHRVPTVGNRVI